MQRLIFSPIGWGLALALLGSCHPTANLRTKGAVAQTDTTVIRCVKATSIVTDITSMVLPQELDTNYVYIYWRGNQRQYVMTHTHFLHGLDSSNPYYRLKQKDIRRLVRTLGDPYGAYYDARNDMDNRRVLADSILKENLVHGHKLTMHDTATINTLVSTQRLGDTLREEWRFVVKQYPTVHGEVSFYFIPRQYGLPYAIDTATERKKGMTLCKLINVIHTGGKNLQGKYQPLDMTIHYEFTEIPVTNTAELLPYFERQRRGEYIVPFKLEE